MAVAPQTSSAQATIDTGKTKAKLRYLRRKKERRKQRKGTTGGAVNKSTADPHNRSTAQAPSKETKDIDGDWEDDRDDAASDNDVDIIGGEGQDDSVPRATMAPEGDVDVEMEVDEEAVERKQRKLEKRNKREKRPKKRQKVDEPVDEPLADDFADQVEEASTSSPHSPTPDDTYTKDAEDIPTQEDVISQPGFLPVFPLPSQPAPPSKLTLALQGLDTALSSAIVVPANSTHSLSNPSSAIEMGITEKMRKRLLELDVSELFAVQTALLPFLLRAPDAKALYMPYSPPRDACVSAPTGSGKTLSYAIPIVEILSTRIVTRLRALIILPTRDLVHQVRETFEALSKSRGLRIGVASGQHSFAHEQASLLGPSSSSPFASELHDVLGEYAPHGGQSKIDILICTPGRLLDHLSQSGAKGFTLQHLRFLVLDEADRLLAKSSTHAGTPDWLARVLAAIRPPAKPVVFRDIGFVRRSERVEGEDGYKEVEWYDIPMHNALAPGWGSLGVPTDLDEKEESSCQTLLFSATLAADPGQLGGLGLRQPQFFVVSGTQTATNADGDEMITDPVDGAQDEDKDKALYEALSGVALERYTMPEGLSEHYIVCGSAEKPLMLFWLLHPSGKELARKRVLVFTKSVESTGRLVKVLELLGKQVGDSGEAGEGERMEVRAFSSDLPAAERKATLAVFKDGKINVLVCSDIVARGLDVPDVGAVVSYDAPADVRKYVHRAGRTARAGKEGESWVLVEEQEAKWWKGLLKENGVGCKRVRVKGGEVSKWEEVYNRALEGLKEQFGRH